METTTENTFATLKIAIGREIIGPYAWITWRRSIQIGKCRRGASSKTKSSKFFKKVCSRYILQRITKEGVYLDPDTYKPPIKCRVQGCDWAGNYRASRSAHMKKMHPEEHAESKKKLPGYNCNGTYLCRFPNCSWRGWSRSTRSQHMKKDHPTWRPEDSRHTVRIPIINYATKTFKISIFPILTLIFSVFSDASHMFLLQIVAVQLPSPRQSRRSTRWRRIARGSNLWRKRHIRGKLSLFITTNS